MGRLKFNKQKDMGKFVTLLGINCAFDQLKKLRELAEVKSPKHDMIQENKNIEVMLLQADEYVRAQEDMLKIMQLDNYNQFKYIQELKKEVEELKKENKELKNFL